MCTHEYANLQHAFFDEFAAVFKGLVLMVTYQFSNPSFNILRDLSL